MPAAALLSNTPTGSLQRRLRVGRNTVFLDRARLTIERQVTATTLLLLGKPEAAHLLSPHPVQITWRLEGPEKAYEHFGPPFLLTTTALYQRIRNIQIRILPDGQLLPVELAKLGHSQG